MSSKCKSKMRDIGFKLLKTNNRRACVIKHIERKKMNIPEALQQAIDALMTYNDTCKIREHVTTICQRYLHESGQGKKLVKTPDEVIAYAVSRMPATYCAVYTALESMCEQYSGQFHSLLDFGSGTGTVSWAADALFSLDCITCVEREQYMIEAAQKITGYGSEAIKHTEWIQKSVTSESMIETPIDAYDLVTASYIMNELQEKEKDIFLGHMWNHANDVILIIEPGTTAGYQNILKARQYFLDRGANMVAPCINNGACNLKENDWCHFSCRLQRNKVQKFVKNGDAPYEDEKFSYIIVSKHKVENKKNMRIIRHPIINKGYIDLRVCSSDGIRDVKVTSRDKALFKVIKKANWGETVSLD